MEEESREEKGTEGSPARSVTCSVSKRIAEYRGRRGKEGEAARPEVPQLQVPASSLLS